MANATSFPHVKNSQKQKKNTKIVALMGKG